MIVEDLLHTTAPLEQRARTSAGLRWPRAEPHSIWPADFLHLLHKWKHPRWWSIGVECSRHGERRRSDVGVYSRSGTIWVASANGDRESLMVVPADELPYWPIGLDVNAADHERMYETTTRRGWRALIRDLVAGGFLRPAPELTYLCGEDTWKLGSNFRIQ